MRAIGAEEKNGRELSFEIELAGVVRVEIPKGNRWRGIAGTKKALDGTPMNSNHQQHGETKKEYKPECCR